MANFRKSFSNYTNPISNSLTIYTFSELLSTDGSLGDTALVTGGTYSNTPVYHDGTNWRYIFNRALISNI